jgi:hypothetical protein
MIVVASVISFVVARHVRLPEIQIIGNLSQSDVAAICKVVKATPELNGRPILSIEVISQDKVEVTTGVVRGPLDGGGRTAILEKHNGIWQVVETGWWMS